MLLCAVVCYSFHAWCISFNIELNTTEILVYDIFIRVSMKGRHLIIICHLGHHRSHLHQHHHRIHLRIHRRMLADICRYCQRNASCSDRSTLQFHQHQWRQQHQVHSRIGEGMLSLEETIGYKYGYDDRIHNSLLYNSYDT